MALLTQSKKACYFVLPRIFSKFIITMVYVQCFFIVPAILACKRISLHYLQACFLPARVAQFFTIFSFYELLSHDLRPFHLDQKLTRAGSSGLGINEPRLANRCPRCLSAFRIIYSKKISLQQKTLAILLLLSTSPLPLLQPPAGRRLVNICSRCLYAIAKSLLGNLNILLCSSFAWLLLNQLVFLLFQVLALAEMFWQP